MHSIKVSADTSAFKRDIMQLSRQLNTAFSGGKKITIFDEETRKFLETGVKKAVADMTKAMDSLIERNKVISAQLKDQRTKQNEILGLTKDYVRNLKAVESLKSDINTLESNHSNILDKQSAMGQMKQSGPGRFIQGMGKSGLGRLPGMGGMGAAKGLGTAGMLGWGLGAGAIGAGVFAASRGFQGFNAFNQSVDDRITLMGRGFNADEASGIYNPAQSIGMTAGQLRQGQIQATDIFGRSGATPKAVTERARVARGMGIGLSEFQGAGEGLRQQLGTAGASKTFAKLSATLIATEIEGAVGPWLETAASMLTQINESGVGLDSGALMALSTLTEGPGGLSPERVQKTLMSIDDSMKSATGEKAGFFMSAMSRQGIGAGSIGGAQVAMQMGLFGGSLEKAKAGGFIRPEDLQEFQAQGILSGESGGADAFRSRMKGISSTFEDIAGGMSGSGRALVAQQLTGIQNPVEALKAMGIIGKLGEAKSPEEREKLKKELKDIQASPEDKMIDRLDRIATSTEGTLQVSQAFKEANLEVLGRQLAPLAVKANEALTNIDKALVRILEFFGIETAQQEAKRMARDQATTIGGDKFATLPKEERTKMNVAMEEEIASLTDKKLHLENLISQKGGPQARISQENVAELKGISDTLKQLLDAQLTNNRAALKSARQLERPSNSNISGQPSTTGSGQ